MDKPELDEESVSSGTETSIRTSQETPDTPSPSHSAAGGLPEEEFRHDDLPPEGDYIRCMTLQPGSTTADPLVCTLHAVALDDLHVPEFEAISYVWGNPSRECPILCNGKRMLVTANLRDALCQVRQSGTESRNLWADSICINQQDTKERGRQVAIMSRIYSSAQSTMICLGGSGGTESSSSPAAAHARVAAEILEEADAMIHRTLQDLDREGRLGQADTFPYPDPDDALLRDPRWESVSALLEHSWFRRAWVVQEAALGQKVAVLWAGVTIEWVKIMRVVNWIVWRAPRIRITFKIRRAALHRRAFNIKRAREAVVFLPGQELVDLPSLLAVLAWARELNAADARDKIYAFLSLPTSTGPLPQMPTTYEKDPLAVYQVFICKYLRATGDLDALRFVEHRQSPPPEVISWVPRWDTGIYKKATASVRWDPAYCQIDHHHTNDHDASGQDAAVDEHGLHREDSSHCFSIQPGCKVLKVRGVLLDRVKRDFKKLKPGPDISTYVASLCRHLSKCSTGQIPPSGTTPDVDSRDDTISVGRSVLRTILMREYATTGQNPSETRAQQEMYLEYLQTRGHIDPSSSSGETASSRKSIELINGRIKKSIVGRRFVLLARGYYALAPEHVRKDDLCCIIFGTRSPFFIRKTELDGQYKLLGATYVSNPKKLDEYGYPHRLGDCQSCKDWVDLGLPEEDIFLC